MSLVGQELYKDLMKPFLTARWSDIVFVNWAIDTKLLEPYLPKGLSLDFFDGQTFVSLVAFRFLDTKVLGIPVPWHCNFEEVNLRFYVTRRDGEGVKRGVVFIKEFVPRFWVALIARLFYNEKYSAIPMSHFVKEEADITVAHFEWQKNQRTNIVEAKGFGVPVPLTPGSREEFISEHYWGYTGQRDGRTKEYNVKHDPWRIWPTVELKHEIDATGSYGESLGAVMSAPPNFTFMADGAPVSVSTGVYLK